jgi:hypothetical protein
LYLLTFDIFISRGQYGELDKLNEGGLICQIWQVSGTNIKKPVGDLDGERIVREHEQVKQARQLAEKAQATLLEIA